MSSQLSGRDAKTYFPTYQKAIIHLGNMIKEVPAFANSPKIFVGRFSESIHKIYCEPLSSNLQNDFIASIGGDKIYLEESVDSLPMIIGEYKRLFTNKDIIKVRIRIGTFIKKKQRSITYSISPWISFPAAKLSPKERACLLKKVIGTAYFIKLPRSTLLRVAPGANAEVATEIISQPLKITGFIDEADRRWWVFLDDNSIDRGGRFLYAHNVAQFIINNNFEERSRECDLVDENPKSQRLFRKNRNLFKQSLKNRISKQGFHFSTGPNVFGVQLLKICQEISDNDINYRVHFSINDKNPIELNYSIEFKYKYAGKTKFYEITGELDAFSKSFIASIKKRLVEAQ